MPKKYSEEFLTEELQRFKRENGRDYQIITVHVEYRTSLYIVKMI